MSTLEVLKELYDEEMNRVFECSANYLMTIPRKGLEKEHEHHIQRANVLKELIERSEL